MHMHVIMFHVITCVYVRIHPHIHAPLYACMFICLYVRSHRHTLCVCVYIYIYIYIYILITHGWVDRDTHTLTYNDDLNHQATVSRLDATY
jgi:hypothetical protein